MEQSERISRMTHRRIYPSSINSTRVNRPPRSINSLFPIRNRIERTDNQGYHSSRNNFRNLERTLNSSRYIQPRRQRQQNNNNVSRVVCPKCSLSLTFNNLDNHIDQCRYKACNFCKQYFPNEFHRCHEKLIIIFKINF